MIPEWRTVKKGALVEKEEKTWHWCPHHYKEGLFDGLYMPHKPEDHDEWAKKKKKNAEKGKKKKDSDGGSYGKSKKSKLELTNGMKQALVTEGNISKDEATALWNSVINAQEK